MSIILLLLGYVCLGYVTYLLTKKLFAAYPYGADYRFWWSKYLPMAGFGLCLIVAGEPIYLYLPGILTIVGSQFFLPRTKISP